jgi:hypothetical protein
MVVLLGGWNGQCKPNNSPENACECGRQHQTDEKIGNQGDVLQTLAV